MVLEVIVKVFFNIKVNSFFFRVGIFICRFNNINDDVKLQFGVYILVNEVKYIIFMNFNLI